MLVLNATRTLGGEAKVGVNCNPFLAVVIYFDIVASAKFYCNEISGVEAKIVFKCNAYLWLQYTLIIATNSSATLIFGCNMLAPSQHLRPYAWCPKLSVK